MTRAMSRRRPLIACGVVVTVLILLTVLVWALWPKSSGGALLHTGTARHIVTVAVEPPRVGDSAVTVTVESRSGASVEHAEVDVRADQVTMGHAGVPVRARSLGSGRFRADAVRLMMAGQWELHLSIDTHDATEEVTLPLWVSG